MARQYRTSAATHARDNHLRMSRRYGLNSAEAIAAREEMTVARIVVAAERALGDETVSAERARSALSTLANLLDIGEQ